MPQTFQNAEKLGLYGKNTVGNTDYYIAAGDSGLITTGGTIGGMVIAGNSKNAYTGIGLRAYSIVPYSITSCKVCIAQIIVDQFLRCAYSTSVVMTTID